LNVVDGGFEKSLFGLPIEPDQFEITDDLIESPVDGIKIGIFPVPGESQRGIFVLKG